MKITKTIHLINGKSFQVKGKVNVEKIYGLPIMFTFNNYLDVKIQIPLTSVLYISEEIS